MRCAGIGLLSIVILLQGCGSVGSGPAVDCDSYAFPSVVWKQTVGYAHRDEATVRRRRQAADALVGCQHLTGMTKQQVTKLLGRHHNEPETPNDWTFAIGPGRGPFSVDDEFLRVLFTDRRVIDTSISDG
jgi:hypothetical protein